MSRAVPLVSVITPVHNGAEYLAECIESVLAQTYPNWDCTIVNNCSTDGSAEIANLYAAKYPRIQMHENQQFLRVIPNHNVALRQISPASKYCKVLFADDWLFPNCLEQMVAVAEEHSSVGFVGAYGLQGRQVMWAGLPYPSRVISGREICRKLFLENLYVFGTATSLLFRADLVRSRDPFYNEANLHADSETCIALSRTCDFGFVHQVLTFTRVRSASLSTMSNEINTRIAGKLYDLVMYGRDFLNREEFELCLDERLSDYYRFLAENLIWGRDKKFWDYHKRKLVEVGVGFDRVRLAKATLSKLSSAVLNPQKTIERVVERRKAAARSQSVPGF